MMKKVLVVAGIVTTMVAGLAAMASAAIDSDWYLNLKASTDSQALIGQSNAKFGLKSTGSQYASYGAAFDPTSPEIRFVDASHTSDARTYVAQYKTSDFAGQNEIVWDFQVMGVSGKDVYLTAWNPSTSAATDLATGDWYVTFYQMANGKRTNAVKFDDATNGAYSSSAGVSGSYFQQKFAYAGTPLEFQMVYTAVPEPGSMLAMLSGLVGLAGFGIRRRK